MITTAADLSEQALKGLWEAVFGDSREYIDLFFSRRFQPEQTLVEVREGEPAAMLFLLDVSLFSGGENMPGYYLYAAGTLPRLRKQGIMGLLLEEARQLAQERGRSFIALKPATPELFGYYKKHGYRTCFYRSTAQVAAAGECDFRALTPLTLLQMQGKYSGGMETVWPLDALEYALLENSASGSALLCTKGEKRLALLYHLEQGACVISDCWGDGELLSAAIAAIGQNAAAVSGPPWLRFPAGAPPVLVPHGMLLPVGTQPFFPVETAFLSLTLG